MESFLPNYSDPIVSILLLLGIVFIVSTLSYAYSIWKQEKKSKELITFLENFDSKECLLDIESMEYDSSMKKPLFLLALAYQKSGNYSKAIELYLYLLKNSQDVSILENLASAYFKAGFLQRALDIYLKIIADYPRNLNVLYQLEFIYEKLNRFEEAQDALDVLKAQGQNIDALNIHLRYQEITKSFKSKEEQFKELLSLMQKTQNYKPFILRKLFKLNPKEAWSYYKDEYFENLIDILNNLKKEDIDLDIISKNILLEQLYYIKSFTENCSGSSGHFALDILSSSKKCGVDSGELKFIYLCQKCKNSYPLYFNRCPNCHRVYSSKIEVLVEQKHKKSGYSLQ